MNKTDSTKIDNCALLKSPISCNMTLKEPMKSIQQAKKDISNLSQAISICVTCQ